MRKRVFILFILISLLNVTNLLSQERIIFNPHFNHFLLNKTSYSPSVLRDSLFSASIDYRNRLGILTEIRELYLDAFFVKKNHQLGLKLFSDQESTIFTKNKAAFIYGYGIKLNHKYTISLGTQIGVANINFGSSQASSGGSDQSLDASISSSFISKKILASITLHQLQESVLVPLQNAFILKRYLEPMLTYQSDFALNWKNEIGVLSQFNNETFVWRINNKTSYYDKGGILLSTGTNGFYSIGGFIEIQKKIMLACAYSDNYILSNTNRNAFNINITYTSN